MIGPAIDEAAATEFGLSAARPAGHVPAWTTVARRYRWPTSLYMTTSMGSES